MTPTESPLPPLARPAIAALATLATAKLLLHLYTGPHYGYFIDELYYLACARHLDWGYVDQPPLIAVIAWLTRHLLGHSLAALRLVPALAGTGEILLTAAIARQLGARPFAQTLAAGAVFAAPGILGLDNLFTMNAFEPLFWLACSWLLLLMLRSGDRRLWLWFGLVAGLGLENKYSMLIFGAGAVLGLLLTPARRLLAGPWPWIGAALALLVFLPNLLWNFHYHFPFLELQANIRRSGRDVALNPLAFFVQQGLTLNPLAIPLWLAGLWFYFRSPHGRPFRFLGWIWLFAAFVIAALSPRIYYLWPAFPLLFAGGAVLADSWFAAPRLRWLRPAYPAALATAGAILAPLILPALPPETFLRYTAFLHLNQPAIENHPLGPLPQLFADQFGWPEMAATVARAFNALPPDVRVRTAIFGQSYGQAGAIDLFGPQYGLPPAISGHQSYYLWGPRGYTGESVLVLDDSQENLERSFASVVKVAHVSHPYSMPDEHFDVFYCQGLKQPLSSLWPTLKHWD